MKKLIIVALIAISFPVLAQNPASFSKLTCPDISIPAGSTTTALHLRNIGGHLFWGTQRIDTIPDAFAGNETDPIWGHDSADYLKNEVAEAAYAKKDSVPWMHHKYPGKPRGMTSMKYTSDSLDIGTRQISHLFSKHTLLSDFSYPEYDWNKTNTFSVNYMGNNSIRSDLRNISFYAHDTTYLQFLQGTNGYYDGLINYPDQFENFGFYFKIKSHDQSKPLDSTLYSIYALDRNGFFPSFAYEQGDMPVNNPALGSIDYPWASTYSKHYYSNNLPFTSPSSMRFLVWDTITKQFMKTVYPDPTNGNTAFGWGNHAGLYWVKADTGSNKKLAAYYDMTTKLAGKQATGAYLLPSDTGSLLLSRVRAGHDYQAKGSYLTSLSGAWLYADTSANKKLAAYYWAVQQLAGKAATNQTMYLGTTSVAINRGSGALSLAGVNIDGTAGNISLAATAGKSLRYISGAWRAWPDSLGSGTVDTTTAGTGLVNKTRMSHLSSYPTLNQNTTGTAGNISLAGSGGQSLRYISGAWRAWADSVGTGGGGAAIDSIWHTAIAGAYASATTFTFTGTAYDSRRCVFSLFQALKSDGSVGRYGYIKSASETGGTVTATVVSSSAIAANDKTFKIAYDEKVSGIANNYRWTNSVPGTIVADASNYQGMFYLNVPDTMYFISTIPAVMTAASGAGAAATYNIYDATTAIYATAPDMSTSTVLTDQIPATFYKITPGHNITLRWLTSAGATTKCSDAQVKITWIPSSIIRAK